MVPPSPWGPLPSWVSDELPCRTDVVVVGGGLAGLSCALRLSEAGVDVVVLESGPEIGEGAVGRGSGLAFLGLCEHPIQLAQALGDQDAEDLIRLSEEALKLLEATGLASAKGGIWCASMEREAEGIQRSTHWLQGRGVACRPVGAADVQQALGQGLDQGRLHPQELCLNPLDLLAALSRRLRGSEGRVCSGRRAESVTEDGTGLVVLGDNWRIETELVVVAAGAWAPEVEPWFQEKVFPVRAQHRLEPQSEPPGALGRSQHGYMTWGPAQGGRLLSGCRWASPHLEIGESTLELNAKVGQKLREFSERRGGASNEEVQEWASIMAFSCDGLPILGPVPGRPRIVACVGFNGQDLSLAMACAEQVARGILEGGVGGISPRLLGSRFADG